MKVFSTSLKEKLKQLDFVILFCAFGMTFISVLTLYGIKNDYSYGSRMFIIQSLAACLGFVGMVIIALFDYDEIVTKLWIPIVIVSLVLIGMVLVFGEEAQEGDGQKLYISIGPINFQASEFVKMLFILSFSKHIDIVKNNINHPKCLIQLLIHAGLVIGAVLLTGDLGTTLVYMCIFAVMLYSAGLSLWYYAAAIGIVIIAFPFIWPHLGEFRQMRILAGFDPSVDPIKYGYQPLMSKSAISAGGFWGAGLMNGVEYKKVPVVTTDFLFTVTCEKFGFFGALAYLVLMTVMIFRMIKIARTSRKDTGTYICAGVIAVLIAQTTENMGMCLAMMPVVGITMPFLSYGGSSMLSIWLTLGLVESVKMHNTKYYFEREKT